MRKDYRISIVVPKSVEDYEIRSYIEEAVASWKGSMDPDDAITHIDENSVRVYKLQKQRRIKSCDASYYNTDEVYCDFFKCTGCGCADIMNGFNFCPSCGSKLKILTPVELRLTLREPDPHCVACHGGGKVSMNGETVDCPICLS
jgi:hypothetical protein